MFYTFSQNNSFGRFEGPQYIIIEANSAEEANSIAESDRTPIYFQGVYIGKDCPCCGNRWSEKWADDGDEEPLIYGKPALI